MADKTSLNKLEILFQCFIVVSDKEANVPCSIGSISRLTSSRDHNAINLAIAIDRYQSYFRKLSISDNFFSGKQQGAVRLTKKFIIFLSTIFAWWLRFSN